MRQRTNPSMEAVPTMRKAGSLLGALVLLGVIAGPSLAYATYPTFAGASGMAVFPTADVADRGLTLAGDFQKVRPSESVFTFFGADEVDALQGRLLWGLGKAELGASFSSWTNSGSGIWDNSGHGISGKVQLLKEGVNGAPVSFALGGTWNEMNPIVATGSGYSAESEDWRWLRVYAAISKVLANNGTTVRGHIGVAHDEFRAIQNDESSSPSTVEESNVASEFNLFAGVDVAAGKWSGSVEWGSPAFSAGTTGFSLPNHIFVADNESVWAITLRYMVSQNFTWQGGYTNAFGQFPIGTSNPTWFTGFAFHFGGGH